jgi:hypothetical protein
MMGKAFGHCYSSDRVRSPLCYQYGRSPFALPLVPSRIPLAGVGVNSATHHPAIATRLEGGVGPGVTPSASERRARAAATEPRPAAPMARPAAAIAVCALGNTRCAPLGATVGTRIANARGWT